METEAYIVRLGRFGHHPDPAIDFCVEVEELEAINYNIEIGFDKLTDEYRERFARALDFCVGGDLLAVVAKENLRRCKAFLERKDEPTTGLTPLEAEMLKALKSAEKSLADLYRRDLFDDFTLAHTTAKQVAGMVDAHPTIIAVRTAIAKAEGGGE